MAISIENSRENSDDKTVYFSIDYDGKKYKWHADIPKDANAKSYLEAKEDTLKKEILLKQYPNANPPKDDEKSELERLEKWVSDGCKVPAIKFIDFEGNAQIKDSEKVIKKREWKDSF